MKKIAGVIASAALLAVSASAQSEGFNQSKFYAGGGVSVNSISGFNGAGSNNAFGFQGFAGYDFSDSLKIGNAMGLAAEAGFMDSGSFCSFCGSAKGLWLNAVGSYGITSKVKLINRLGFDFGDSDGVMVGLGGEYDIDKHLAVRGEVVMRGYKSYQVNALYRF